MARISFTAIVSEIVGKLAGSVFQYSYGGYQIHTKGKPRNPQTQLQQLRRGDFGYLSAGYRSLTPTQRQTFINNSPAGTSAINFFLQSNINLTLISIPAIDTYVPSGAVPDFNFQVNSATPEDLIIQAAGGSTTVPAGYKLLVYSTYTKAQTKIFTNPSQYSPITTFDEGSDLTIPQNVIAAYNTLYGQLPADMYLCMKVVLIDKSNGKRGTEQVTCINSTAVPVYYIPLHTNGNDVTVGANGDQDFDTFAIPANTLVDNGDRIEGVYYATYANNGQNKAIGVRWFGQRTIGNFTTGVSGGSVRASLIRTGTTTATLSLSINTSATEIANTGIDLTGLDFTISNNVAFNTQLNAATNVVLKSNTIVYIKAPL